MGMQVSCGVHPEIPAEVAICDLATRLESGVPGLVDHVHELLSGPPKYSVAQVMGFHQREERDPHRPGICRTAKELCGAALLGARILGVAVGKNETAVLRYIQELEKEDQRLDQLEMLAL